MQRQHVFGFTLGQRIYVLFYLVLLLHFAEVRGED
jgi:hypothetical protein